VFIVSQVGSLVDGADQIGNRNSKYLYMDVANMQSFAYGPQMLRTVLVESVKPISKGETILVFYGRGYFELASSDVLSTWSSMGSCGS
jgi:hypothetical protein